MGAMIAMSDTTGNNPHYNDRNTLTRMRLSSARTGGAILAGFVCARVCERLRRLLVRCVNLANRSERAHALFAVLLQ